MNPILENILTRHSTKSYKPDNVPDELIEKITAAGIAAASGMNRQSPIVIAITNKEIRDKLASANASIMGASTDPFYGAPAVLVVLADKSVRTAIYDGSLVMGNMMLAAKSLGLGSAWIHRAKEVFELSEWKEYLKSLGIDGEYEGIGNLIVGYADTPPIPKERRPGRVLFVK